MRKINLFIATGRQIELPKIISARCIELVHKLGRQFGAIDLLLTPNGKYMFLEVNPTGQWLWIEVVTGMPLLSSMCDFLAHH